MSILHAWVLNPNCVIAWVFPWSSEFGGPVTVGFQLGMSHSGRL